MTHVAGTCFPSTDQTSLEWEVANEGKNEKEEEKVSASPPESGLAEEVDEGEEDSESGEEEFTPSTWNSELTPNRSLLKSPETNSVSKVLIPIYSVVFRLFLKYWDLNILVHRSFC